MPRARPGRTTSPPPEEPAKPKKRFRWLKRLLVAGMFAVLVVCGLAYWYYTTVPLPPDKVPVETSVIYAADGTTELAQLFDGENRTVVALSAMPKVLVDAVVASEDHNFYQHGGLDPLGIGRALWSNIRSRGSLQGGSTITQQYVKNAYLNSERTVRRKLREGVIAIKLEQRFSKDQILEKYLNTIYFGRGAYGVQAAAQAYFRHDVATLTLSESAYLAGLIRSPETADATRDLTTAHARRRRVLTAMVRYNKITADEAAVAQASSLADVVVPRAGPASTYSAAAVELHAEAYVNVLRSQLVDEFGARQTYGGGLRVVSSLDVKKQRAAWRSIAKTLTRADDPEAALVALDDRGQVVAMIGGRSAYAVSQVNRAIRGAGSPGRQAGSTFKPVVLAAVLDAGYTVESAFRAPAELTVASVDVNGTPWTPKNFDNESFGDINLIDATRLSVNTVYAQIVTATEITPERVVAMAQKLGIGKRDKDGAVLPLRAFPTIALGAQETSPLEMADAYLTFARRGERADPRFLLRVTDGKGAVRYAAPERVVGERVLTKQQADVMNYVLQQVVVRGTGVGARIARPLAGKTGTTNDNRDAWFVGYTAGRCCSVAVWMGYDDNHQMRRVHGRRVNGGSFPADIAAAFLTAATKGTPAEAFEDVTKFPGEVLAGRRVGSGLGVTSKKKPTAKGSGGTGVRVTAPVDVNTPAVTDVDGGQLPVVQDPDPNNVPAVPQPDPVPAPPPSTAPQEPVPAPAPVPVPVAPQPDPLPPPG